MNLLLAGAEPLCLSSQCVWGELDQLRNLNVQIPFPL